MNTTLHYYTPEIMDIAHENHVHPDIALDMFINNIDDATNKEDQYHYIGADQLDYVALQSKIPAKKTNERNQMKVAWDADVDAHTQQIHKFIAEDDVEGLRNFMVALAETH